MILGLRLISAAYLVHLEAEILWLRQERLHERQRAERAIDTLLQLKPGVLPVTPLMPRELSVEEKELVAIMKDPEFTRAGSLEETG